MNTALRLLIILATSALFVQPAAAQDIRADFLKLIDRPRVDAAVQITPLPPHENLSEFHFTYAADSRQRVPGILIKPPSSFSGTRPVVIALHGTGGTKADELPLLRRLAAVGFIGVAIDGPWHGERSQAGKGSADYEAAVLRAWQQNPPLDSNHVAVTQLSDAANLHEHPFFYDTVWDVMRLIDYLKTRDDVDGRRIGLYGVSKGGIETYLTAAVDSRVAVAIPCISVESFRWAIDNNTWQHRIETVQHAFDSAAKISGISQPGPDFVRQFYARVCPAIDGEFDGPAMVPLIAPRPLMAINGEIDPRTPPPSLKLCTDAAQTAYHAAKADDHLLVRVQTNTAHKVNADSEVAAIDWFVKWLKP